MAHAIHFGFARPEKSGSFVFIFQYIHLGIIGHFFQYIPSNVFAPSQYLSNPST
jgi:hypothetical protein